jgi:hypothetical protein
LAFAAVAVWLGAAASASLANPTLKASSSPRDSSNEAIRGLIIVLTSFL